MTNGFHLLYFHFLQAEAIVPYLLQCVEKANQQQAQTPLVTEALYASCLLCKMEEVEFAKRKLFLQSDCVLIIKTDQ